MKDYIAGIFLAFALLWNRNSNQATNPPSTIPPVNPPIIPPSIQIQDIINALPVHPTKNYGVRSVLSISQVVVHHSATSQGSPQAYANYHVNENDWPGIGYHFVIQKDGTVFQTNYLETVSYHTSGQNSQSIGICLTGNFDLEYPTPIQLQNLKELIQWLESHLGIFFNVYGHNEFSQKSCPGNNFDLQYFINQALT